MPKNRTYFSPYSLVARGGGGGGGSETTLTVSVAPTPPPAPSSTFEELKAEFEGYYEYRNHWGLEAINSSSAKRKRSFGIRY